RPAASPVISPTSPADGRTSHSFPTDALPISNAVTLVTQHLGDTAHAYATNAHKMDFLDTAHAWHYGCFFRAACWCCINRICNLRSEEHTSELQSRLDGVSRLLLEQKRWHSC